MSKSFFEESNLGFEDLDNETTDVEVVKDDESDEMGEEEFVQDGASLPNDFLKFLARMSGRSKAHDEFDDNEFDDDEFDDDEFDDDDDSDDSDDSDMSVDDYHNKAVDRARRGRIREATELCVMGLKKFPLNIDLLSDAIKYSSEAGDMNTAKEYYTLLSENVPFTRWNWRAFTFSFDYLLKADPVANADACRNIVNSYKKFLPYEEKASMAESELESALGNDERSMQVLKEAICMHTNASQCALRLADMLMDRGMYEEVLSTANYGIAASAETQPSINVPYLYYLRALAEDHLLHKKVFLGKEVSEDEVEVLKREYQLLKSEFPELMGYARTIQLREKLLKFINLD